MRVQQTDRKKMNLITLDFETYYGDDYTLSKMTTEAYVRDPRFEAIMVGIKINDGKSYTVTGKNIKTALWNLDMPNSAVLCHHCMKGDVEILTRKGWCRLDQLEKTEPDRVAQWDSKTGEISFTPYKPIKTIFAGSMLVWNTTFHSCAYTPNHRVYYQTPDRLDWRVDTAEVVARKSANNTYIPLSGWNKGGSLPVTADEARLIEAIRADGSMRKTSGSTYVRFRLGKARKIQRVKYLLDLVGVPYGIGKAGKFVSIHTRRSARLNTLCALFVEGKQYGAWVLDLSESSQIALVEEVAYWDGSKRMRSGGERLTGGFGFSTVDPSTAEWLQILFHLNGYRCRGTWVNNNRGFGSGNNQKLFVAGVRKTYRAKLVVAAKQEAYSGSVYCVTVPTGAVVVRSRGIIHITGNSHFDGLILSHHYGLNPKIWFDTLSMGRAELGSVVAKGMSLGSMSSHLGLGEKGHEVVAAKGKHAVDFTPWEFEAYQKYCCNDVDLTYEIHKVLYPAFSVSELKLIDLTIRLFTEPVLSLDAELLQEYRYQVLKHKDYLMLRSGVTREELMSNNKFAEVLRRFGVEPAMKDSPTAKLPDGTPKRTYAFAKTDDAMKELLEHQDETIQMLAEARLGVKTSIAETRAQRFIDMSKNGAACVYLKYWGAEQTGRHGGGDRTNFQNLGRSAKLEEWSSVPGSTVFTPTGAGRVIDAGAWGLTGIATDAGQFPTKKCHKLGLRDSILAPEGHAIVVGDSSNIEARMACWIAGQEDVLDKYRAGADLYCEIASEIYQRPITKEDFTERQLGKVVTLGCGFGMGKNKFYDTATGSQWRIEIEKEITDLAVETFREKYHKLVAAWKYLNAQVIPAMADGRCIHVDELGLIQTTKEGLILPNGRTLRYSNLHQRKNPDPESYFKTEWVFDVREGSRVVKTRLYGGKLFENIVQALARIIVLDQAVTISRRYKVVLLVHDEVVCCVPQDEACEAKEYLLGVMSCAPAWAAGLPLAAEAGFNRVYSLAK